MEANQAKIQKKAKRTREVNLQEAEEYLKRPIRKVEDLNAKLRNSYQQGHFRNERFAYLKELAHSSEEKASTNERKKITQETDRIFHESSSVKDEKPKEGSSESSLDDSSHQLSSQPSALNRKSRTSKRGKDNKNSFKKQTTTLKQAEMPKLKANTQKAASQSQEGNDSNFNSNQQEDGEPQQGQPQPEEPSQPGKRRRRRTKAQMLLAHKIEALKCFLNKKKYIKKKLRPKPLNGPAPSIEEEWKTDLQKYNGLKELIEKEIRQREQLMNKIDSFGDADDLEEIENEKESLCKKGLLKINPEKPKSQKSSERNRSRSSSSSSSSSESRKSQKSNEKREQENAQKRMQSEVKRESSQQDSDSAQAICKGKKKDIQHFKKLIDDNLEMLKQKPPQRRKRKVYVSSHREYRYPKTKPKRKGKERPVQEAPKEPERQKVAEGKQKSVAGKEKTKKVEQVREASLKIEEKAISLRSSDKERQRLNVRIPDNQNVPDNQRNNQQEVQIKRRQKADKVSASEKTNKPQIPSVPPPPAPKQERMHSSNASMNMPPPYPPPNGYMKQPYKPIYSQYDMPHPYMDYPPAQMLNNPLYNRPMLYHPYQQINQPINHPTMPHLPNVPLPNQIWKGPRPCDCIDYKRRRLTLQPRIIVQSIFFRFTNQIEQSRSAVDRHRKEQLEEDHPRKKRHLRQIYSDSEDEEIHYRQGSFYKYPKGMKGRRRYRKLAHEDYSDDEGYDEVPVRRVVRRIKRTVLPEESVKQEEEIVQKRSKTKPVLEIQSAQEENNSQNDKS